MAELSLGGPMATPVVDDDSATHRPRNAEPVRKMNGALGRGSGLAVQSASMTDVPTARFRLGQAVRHRDHAFAGVVVDVDAAYAGTPADVGDVDAAQPFYRVLATGDDGGFVAYAAEDVLTAAGSQLIELPAGWLRKDASGRMTPAAHRLQ
jgi:heat shock protein HspQ